jgi:hypothetical protein
MVHAAVRRASKRLSQPSSWFQLAKFRLTTFPSYLLARFTSRCCRHHNVSTRRNGRTLLQCPNRPVDCGRAEVHIPHGRGQMPVSSEFLNRSDRHAIHGQMTAERMAQHVGPFLAYRVIDRSNSGLVSPLMARGEDEAPGVIPRPDDPSLRVADGPSTRFDALGHGPLVALLTRSSNGGRGYKRPLLAGDFLTV